MKFRTPFLCALALFVLASHALPQTDVANQKLAYDVFKQLIEINTTDSVGNVTTAAEAMAKRFRDAGFPESDIQVLGPNERKKNLVVRLHGTGAKKPILLSGHLDVVEARREDWTTDPFQFVEKDGYYYGRGTQDMKSDDAIYVANLIRLHQEGYKPDRDIILALTADEEGGKSNGVDWLLQNHRELIDVRMSGHVDEQVELLRRQTNRLPADADATIVEVRMWNSPTPNAIPGVSVPPPKGHPDSGQQSIRRKRLHDVVVSPLIERRDLGRAVGVRGHDDDG